MQLQLSILSTALFASVAYCGTMTFLPSGSNCVLALSDYYSCSQTSTSIGVYNSAKNSCSAPPGSSTGYGTVCGTDIEVYYEGNEAYYPPGYVITHLDGQGASALSLDKVGTPQQV